MPIFLSGERAKKSKEIFQTIRHNVRTGLHHNNQLESALARERLIVTASRAVVERQYGRQRRRFLR
jgi:hypothetical protein